MKNLLKLLPILLLLTIVSCGKDGNQKSSTDELVDTWELTGLDYTGSNTTSAGGLDVVQSFVGEGKDFNASIEFKDDGTFVSMGTYNVTLTTTTSGISTTDEVTVDEFLGEGTYTFDGSTITIVNTDSDVSSTGTITIDANDLTMLVNTNDVTNGPAFTSTVVIDQVIKLSK